MRRIVTGFEVVRWVAERTGEYGNYGASVGIGVERDGTLIGGVVFYDWNGVNINMGTAGQTGSNWLDRTSLYNFFYYPFEQIGAKRITALVGEGNIKSQMLVEGVGFAYETTLDGAHPTGDLLVYCMRPEQCRWLNIKRPTDECMAA